MERASDILRIISARKAAGEPFALATVVRTVAATAAKAGAKAVILPDGTISEGWIGGGCARAAVLKAAKDAPPDEQSRLVAVQPPDRPSQGHASGEEVGRGPLCQKHVPQPGTMDIFVEPVLPRSQIIICGSVRSPSRSPTLPTRRVFRQLLRAGGDEQAAFAR
jgi:xanthine dehydrogenase accessory factor